MLCLYVKKVTYDITINLQESNHGNQIILEMLTRVVLWDDMENLIHICLIFLDSFEQLIRIIKLCNEVVWLNKE